MPIAQHIQKVIQFLSQPENYPHPVESVKIVQTHASIVAITQEWVYKIKKPVNFGFLDFSTLEKRKFYCEEEIHLNQRLTEGIYESVGPIYQQNEIWNFSNGEVIEYAVKMQCLNQEDFLDYQLEQEHFDTIKINWIVEKLVTFYQSLSSDENIKAWGSLEKIQLSVEENFSQMKDFVGHTLQTVDFQTIQDYQSQFLAKNEALFSKRQTDGKIIEGHGDLKTEHVHFRDNQVNIYDCIEFNERFRYLDQLSDIAFLAMDLDFMQHHDYSEQFVQTILPQIEDNLEEAQQLLNFYKSYRACVKGKVESMKSLKEEISNADRLKSQEKAQQYFRLALRYATLGSGNQLIAVFGGIATGKSTLAKTLAQHWGIQHWNSDVIRKQMTNLPLTERPDKTKRSEIYTPEMSQKVYAILLEKGAEIAQKEGTVLLDATFSQEKYLTQLIEKAKEAKFQLIFIETYADLETIKTRLKKRETEDSISDARLEDLERLQTKPIQIPKEYPHYQVNTGQALEESLHRLFHELSQN